MQSPFFLIALLVALASQVLAFEIAVGDNVFTTTQLYAIPDGPVKTACAANCTNASQITLACNDDTACLCSNQTYNAMLTCQTCMFHHLIATNKPIPDPRAGSNVLVGAYAAVCKMVNPAIPPAMMALALPSTWDGLVVMILPFGAEILVCIVGAIMGFIALLLLANI